MAQVSRALRRTLLQIMPTPLRMRLLENYPNFRKAAPEGMRFVFPRYLGDISVNIDTRFKVERIMWTGMYEPPLMRFLQHLDTKEWTSFDIGANVGAITLALAKFSVNGKTYAFEPGPPNLRRLRANLDLNPELTKRAEVIEAGVGRTAGELYWEEEKGNPGNALIGEAGSHKVSIIVIDDFVRERAISRLDFVKIDVEGMELEVMKGAEETLKRFRPILYFETLPRYTDSTTGASFKEMETYLVEKLGYHLFQINKQGQLRAQSASHHASYTVAVHPSKKLWI